MMLTIQRLPVPVIARVQGIATAAGCQLVAACDLAVAADSARFAVSGVNLGLFCSSPSVPLSRNVARKPAFEMLVTGEFISADEARARGLVNRVASTEALDGEVESLVAAIVAKPRVGDRARQGALLPPARERRRGRLRGRRPDDGLQHDGGRHARGRPGLHRQAQARLAELAHRGDCPTNGIAATARDRSGYG